jgi:two-component system, OmpR family, heavy metal sensor histidine kinase CusS
MRSIRLSLIVYFLVLLALAMGGVSWFAYQTTAQALRGKRDSTKVLIESQYTEQKQQIATSFDNRILHKAQFLAKTARVSKDYLEPLFAIGAMGTGLQPQGYLNAPLWLASGSGDLSVDLFLKRPSDIVIKDAEDVLPHADGSQHQGQEYFQTYSRRGKIQQHSENLGQRLLMLDEQVRGTVKFGSGHFDTIEPEAGWKLRIVTLKAPVDRPLRDPTHISFRLPPPRFRSKNQGKRDFAAKGSPGEPLADSPPVPPPGPRPGGFERPIVFVQYASETAPMDKELADLLSAREDKFTALESETHGALVGLRWHLLWISLATFAGIVVGGLVLVRVGLAPLARLSEAVSQVSERNFRLKINPRELPAELQPIAARLTDTLEQLKQAFAREKQAAADISHELRTPLAAMMTTLDLSLRKARTAAEYREMLADIRSSGAQMAHLVERLLALARLDAGADRLCTQEVDVREIARQCTNLIRPLAEARGLALRLHAPDPVPLHVDPDKLREILNNLLHNAVEYNRPQGAIDLNVGRVNGHVQLKVSDTGIGIAPEQRQQIFERFFRADPSRHADTPHAGLGLSIVKSYVDLMGGRIDVDSTTSGSTFTIALPAQ